MKIKDYFTPNSYIYTGTVQSEEMIIHHYQIGQDVVITKDFTQLPDRMDYIQVIGLSKTDALQRIHDHFSIDSHVFEDILNVKQRNKIEVRGQTLFAVFHVNYLVEGVIKSDYMSLLLFEDTLISFHETTPDFLSPLHDILLQNGDLMNKPISYVFYLILDMITDHHLAVYENLEQLTQDFEEDVLEQKNMNQETFYRIRKHLLKLTQNVQPIFEQFTMLLKTPNDFIPSSIYGYFDDVQDHLSRLVSHLTAAKELQRQILDVHMNNQSNKMNRIMTTLTLFSAIFIPLYFLTGFFGMNFVHFQILEYEHAIGLFIFLCMILAGLMILLFKKMKWF
jgi:magnesium transporter